MKRALTLIATILITMSLAAQERVQVIRLPRTNMSSRNAALMLITKRGQRDAR